MSFFAAAEESVFACKKGGAWGKAPPEKGVREPFIDNRASGFSSGCPGTVLARDRPFIPVYGYSIIPEPKINLKPKTNS